MVLAFLKKLVGGGGERPPEPADPVEHDGYTIVASPRDTGSGWSTEGVIRRTVDGSEKEVHFIRADVLMSRDDAVQFAVSKARQIINEQGEHLFDATRV